VLPSGGFGEESTVEPADVQQALQVLSLVLLCQRHAVIAEGWHVV
jgi:hypothetical protein